MQETILVLGGGIVGLSCAFRLRREGYKVTLLEAKECGGQASGAAAGMLGAFTENTEQPDSFFQLCLQSLRLYPQWHRDVQQVSGLQVEYDNCGSLTLAFHEADLLGLQTRLLWQNRYGAESDIVTGNALKALEAHVSPEAVGALVSPNESHVYAPDYVRAMEFACRKLGVKIFDRLGQVELESVSPVRLRAPGGETFEADRLIVCSGAWAQQMEERLGLPVPVYPIRGQICAYRLPERLVRHMVFGSQGYVVYKGNGTLVCGASEDIAGFQTSVTDKGIGRLQRWSEKMFPFLHGMEPFHKWAGLRPSTQDGYPLIGEVPGAPSITLAVGHYRNGILLSPVTAEIICGRVTGHGEFAAVADPFAPNRFHS